MSFCRVCGAEVPTESHLCPKCGQVITEEYNPYSVRPDYTKSGYAADSNAKARMSFFRGVLTCLRKYATFTGRARRKEFVSFQVFALLLIIFVPLSIPFLDLIMLEWNMPPLDHDVFMLGYQILLLSLMCPSVAVAVRRLHDLGLPGWFLLKMLGYLLLGIICILPAFVAIGVIVHRFFIILILFEEAGVPEDNQYGPDPLRAPN